MTPPRWFFLPFPSVPGHQWSTTILCRLATCRSLSCDQESPKTSGFWRPPTQQAPAKFYEGRWSSNEPPTPTNWGCWECFSCGNRSLSPRSSTKIRFYKNVCVCVFPLREFLKKDWFRFQERLGLFKLRKNSPTAKAYLELHRRKMCRKYKSFAGSVLVGVLGSANLWNNKRSI